MSDEAELGYTPLKVTLKAGAGFEAPWLTVEADTAAELALQLVAVQADGVLERIVEASRAFRSTFTAAPSAAKAPAQPHAPEAGSGNTQPTPPQEGSAPASGSSEQAPNLGSGPTASRPAAVSNTQNVTTRDGSADYVTAEDPIAAELNAATDLKQLRAVYPKYKNNGWSDHHIKLAMARKAALEGNK